MLTKLTSPFHLFSNKLSAMPTQLGNLAGLTSGFSLRYNKMSLSIPTELGRLSDLKMEFRIDHNSLTSVIPVSMGGRGWGWGWNWGLGLARGHTGEKLLPLMRAYHGGEEYGTARHGTALRGIDALVSPSYHSTSFLPLHSTLIFLLSRPSSRPSWGSS